MPNRSVFVLLPDGVGLRNFAFSQFADLAASEGFDLTYWNNTPFDLEALGLNELKMPQARPRAQSDLLKRARNLIDLNRNVQRSGDRVYEDYIQKSAAKGLKNALKNLLVSVLVSRFASESKNAKLRHKINQSERKGDYYRECLETLKREKPALVFCTNQRPLTAIAPILAARDLGIPTVAFIFSWDNIPKATMVVDADYYMVWSEFMKNELLHYYPYISADRILVTGTPQFESHFDPKLLETRDVFFSKHGLDLSKRYICFSGDDITTSPYDELFLADVADAVRELNRSGENLGVLFRRCPVDFSTRYDSVLEKNNDIIVAVAPAWKKMGEVWNTILPTKDDLALQANTVAHTEFVVNLGSSMVFDYVCHDKPCAFLNYDPQPNENPDWSVAKVYGFVHFRSMPGDDAVFWFNDRREIAAKIKSALDNPKAVVGNARNWFKVINEQPPTQASARILESIKFILRCTSVS